MKHSKLFIILTICVFAIVLFLDIYNIIIIKNSIQKLQEKNAQQLLNSISASILTEFDEYYFNYQTKYKSDSLDNTHHSVYNNIPLSNIIENGFSQFKQLDPIVYILVENQDSVVAVSNHSILSDLQREKDSLKQLKYKNSQNAIYKSFRNIDILELSKAIEIPGIHTMQVRFGYNIKEYKNEYNNILSYSIFWGIFAILLSIVIIVYIATRKNTYELNDSQNNVRKALRNLFDNFAEGIVILDQKKYIKYINQAASEIFEIDKLTIINKHYSQYFDFDYFNIDNVISEGSPSAEMNVMLPIQDGNTKYLSYTTGLVEFSFNKSKFLLIVLRDISEQVISQKHEELEERKIVIEQIAHSLADRIKNPLNAIYLIINQMEQNNSQEFNPSSIRTMKGEIKNINNVIDVFLEYAKPINIHPQKINLADICDDIIATYSNTTDSKRITFHKDYPIYIPVDIDPSLIKQSIIKLLEKSISTLDVGDIIISIKNDKNNTQIYITDNGAGMSEYEIKSLFVINFSSNEDLSSLELAKVKQVIQLHKGNLKINSKKGCGTTYEISLPNKI